MKKAVIIDDDLGVIEALQAALELWDFEGVGVRENKKILSTLREVQPQLIFLDLLLSGTDGQEVTRLIRSEKEFARIPIILMSAHPRGKDISTKIDVNGFLPKPFSLDVLQHLIRTVSSH